MEAKQQEPTQLREGLRHLRYLRFRLRRFWRLPEGMRVFTPVFSGIFFLTATSIGLTFASYAMLRLLPNMELVRTLAGKLPGGILELLERLPALLNAAQPATVAISGALVSPEAYIITYACGGGAVFCMLLLLVAFVKRW